MYDTVFGYHNQVQECGASCSDHVMLTAVVPPPCLQPLVRLSLWSPRGEPEFGGDPIHKDCAGGVFWGALTTWQGMKCQHRALSAVCAR
jgi:hypothetical protein